MAAWTKEGLTRLQRLMARHVEAGEVPGLVALVSRRGETHVEAVGALALDGAPVQRDSIFRIASMTKPIVAAAAMMLVEDGLLRLDAPLDPHLPELANRMVLRRIESEVDDVVPAARALTLRDLLTFRCGYGAIMTMPGTYPIQTALDARGLASGPENVALPGDEFLKRLGTLPLAYQPGETFLYDTGADILAVLIARVSGQSLGTFLAERIFVPLGMVDTGFFVSPESMARFATQYQPDHETGGLSVWDEARNGVFSKPPVFESGGGGLVSTADDYAAFLAMMLSKGQGPTHRLLSRASVELMTTNHLTPEQRRNAGADMFFGDHSGWGFGMAVCIARTDIWASPGRFGWDGGYGTSAYADPANQMTGILLTQRMMDSPQPPAVWQDFWTSAYAALSD